MTNPAARTKVVYRITYPNGKIYVGLDLTDTTLYFGSSSAKANIAADFTPAQRRDFSIRKEILWESQEATDAQARAMEVKLIRELRSNDSAVGYNLWPKSRELAPSNFSPVASDGSDVAI